MKVNFNECFSYAVKEVISNLCQCEDVILSDFQMKEFSTFENDFSVFLNVAGKYRGSVFYGMDKNFALELSSIMIGFPVSEIDELSKSSLLEVGNIISGKAMTKLSEQGSYSETTIPVIMNKGVKIPFKNPLGVFFTAETPIGKLCVGISLRE